MGFHIFELQCHIPSDDLLVVLDHQPLLLHHRDRGRLRELDQHVLLLVDQVAQQQLEQLDAPEERVDVHVHVGLVARLFDLVAVRPGDLAAEQRVDPVEDLVLDVPEEVEVLLPDLGRVAVVAEGRLRHDHLVAVPVVVEHAVREDGDQDAEQTARIGDHVVDFSDRSFELLSFVGHVNANLTKNSFILMSILVNFRINIINYFLIYIVT